MLKVITAVLPGGEKLRATTRIGGKTRQRTIPVDYNMSWDKMHGTVAGTLLASLNLGEPHVKSHKKESNHYHIFLVESFLK